jgi:hypothetical protein
MDETLIYTNIYSTRIRREWTIHQCTRILLDTNRLEWVIHQCTRILLYINRHTVGTYHGGGE